MPKSKSEDVVEEEASSKKKKKKKKKDKNKEREEEDAMIADSEPSTPGRKNSTRGSTRGKTSERKVQSSQSPSRPRRRERRGSIPLYMEPTRKYEVLSPDLNAADFLERSGIVAGFESVLHTLVEGGYVGGNVEGISAHEVAARQLEKFAASFHYRVQKHDDFLQSPQMSTKKTKGRSMPWDGDKFQVVSPVKGQ